MPLRRGQLLPDKRILPFGPRDDAVCRVGNDRQLTWWQFICRDQACKSMLIL
jgi:hypothetical protein